MNRALFFVISLEGQILRAVLAAGCAVLMAALSGCGGGYGLTNNNPPDNNPVPSVTSLSPTSAVTGAGAQTLTIDGSGFISSSSVSFNGTAHTASFVSSSVLTISLSASDQANAGTFAVTVTNPSP